MVKCPYCQAELGDSPELSAPCPSCGRIPTGDPPAGGDGGDQQRARGQETVDERMLSDASDAPPSQDIRQTIDEDAIVPAGMQTIDESQLPADEGDSVDNLQGNMQTVDESTVLPDAGMQTIDESQLPADEGDSVDNLQRAMETVDESTLNAAMREQQARQTIDESQLPPGGAPAPGEGASGDPRQTIDESSGAAGSGDAGSGDAGDGMRTIDDASLTDALGEKDANIAVGSSESADEERDTLDDRDVSRTIDVVPPLPGETGTIDDKIEKTLDDEAIAAMLGAAAGDPASKKDKGTGTVNERNISQTLDISQSPEGAPEDKGTGTVNERNISQTLDGEAVIPLAGAGQPPKEGTVSERTVAQTIDSGEISPEAAARIQATWQGSVGAGVTSMTSIKREFSFQATESSSLVIHPRRFAERKGKQAPTTGADYDILTLLGEGGMGMVYAARQASIDRTVAVKTLKPDTAKDRQQRDKFLSEAVVTGDLEHPNIVPIYDVGMREDGSLFYSMKRVQGTPWMDVIHDKSLHENLEILMKVADAMGFAHDKKVVHRDLKPENVMLGGYGEVLVMDWGLAVPSDGRRIGGIVQSLSMGGTPAYMAPEMAAGPFEKIGFCSDIYLLGAILYEIVTGTPPHTGEDVMKCLFAAARNQIRSTNKSGELVDIALQAMASKPEDRFATVADFQTAVREYLSHSESVALSTRAAEDLEQAGTSDDYQDFAKALFGFEEAYSLWSGNERAKHGMSETALAYAGSAMRKGDFDLGVSLLKADDPSHGELLVQLRESIKERDARQRRLKTAKRVMIGGAVAIVLIISTATALVYNQYQAATLEAEKARIAENKALVQKKEADEARVAAEEQRVAADKAKEDALAQKTAADKAKEDALAQKTAADMAKEEALTQKAEADKQRMAAEMAQTVAQEKQEEAVREKNEADRQRKFAEYQAYVALIGLAAAKIEENAFDVARELLASCDVKLRNWEWGRLMHLCEQDVHNVVAPTQIDALAVSPDGQRFVVGGWNGNVSVWKFATDENGRPDPDGGITPEFQLAGLGSTSFVYAVAFSPDGALIATGGDDPAGYVRLWNAETGEELPGRFPNGGDGHTDAVTSVEFSADGKWLLTSSYDKTAKLWNVADGRVLNSYFGHSSWVWDASFAPPVQDAAGKSLGQQQIVTASQDGTALVWKVRWSMQEEAAKQHVTPPFMGHRGPIYSAAFSHDGQRVVTGGYDKRVLVWRPDEVKPFEYEKAVQFQEVTPPKFKAFDGHTAAVRTVSFSADDKLIVSGGHDNTVRVWNMETGRLHKSLRGHGSWVRTAAFTGDSQWIVSGGYDQRVKLWNVEGYSESKVLQSRALLGHADAILAARFSHDGNRIVTASRDRSAKIWSLETGQSQHDLIEGHAFLATSAAFFPDGKHIATAALDNTVRIWDVATGTESLMFDGTGRNAALAVSPDGNWILTGSDDTSAKLWDTSGRLAALPADAARAAEDAAAVAMPAPAKGPAEPKALFAGHAAVITAVAFSPDGRTAATGDARGKCIVWDLSPILDAAEGEAAPPTKRHELVEHTLPIQALAFTRDGRLFTAGDKTVYAWDLKTGTYDRRQILRHGDTVTSMAVSQDGQFVFTACRDGGVRQWDVLRASQLRMFQHQMMSTAPSTGADEASTRLVNSIVLSTDGARLLTVASVDRSVRLWNVATGQEIAFGEADAQNEAYLDFNQLGGVVWTAAFSTIGDQVLTVGGNSARLWDIDRQLAEEVRRERMTFSPQGVIASAVFSADNSLVVTSSWDNSARVWDAQTGNDVLKLTGGHDKQVNTAVFSQDGQHVLTSSDDGTAKLWKIDWDKWKAAKREGPDAARDGEFAEVVRVFEGHTGAVHDAVFSPDESQVLTASADKSARIWNAATGELLGVLPGADAGKAAAAPAGAAEPEAVAETKGHEWAVLCAVFSADGKRVLTGSADDTAKIWNVEDVAKPVVEYTLRGHTASVTSVTFSPDVASRVLTGSEDYTAKLWDADNGKEILTLKGHDQEVTSVAFSDDGQYALTGSRDGTAIVWLSTAEGWEQKKPEAVEPEVKAADAGGAKDGARGEETAAAGGNAATPPLKSAS
ncbi:MAG: protein kinase [Pirellulaceae bacterium]